MIDNIDLLHPITLNVGLAIHNADWNWQDVCSPFTRIYYVTVGEADIILPSGCYALRPGHLYMIPAFMSHSYHCTSHFEHYYVHVYEEPAPHTGILEQWEFPVEVKAEAGDLYLFERLTQLNPQMRLPQSNPCSYDNDTSLSRSIRQNKQRSLALKVESRGILFQLIARFFSKAHPRNEYHDSRIRQAIDYIQQHLSEPISIEGLAADLCLCSDHFIRLFKNELRQTPCQYITRKRVEQAQLMLITQQLSVKEIAFRLGFDDPSYFIRLFKRTVGCTPQAYKEQQG